MGKLKILAIPPDGSGVGYFRIVSPYRKLNEKYGDLFDITIDPSTPLDCPLEWFKQFDVVHYSKSICGNPDRMREIVKYLKENNIVNILDIDDHYDLGQFHPMGKLYAKSGRKEQIIENIRSADYVTTTTPIFANVLNRHNTNVLVFPNAIDTNEAQFQPHPVPSKRLRFGIICGSSHEHDLMLLKGMTNSLPKDILNQIQIVLCGFDLKGTITVRDQEGRVTKRNITPTESVWFRYEKIITDDYKMLSPAYRDFLLRFMTNVDWPNHENEFYRRCWTKPIQTYATHYNNIDVLLAPLRDCQFNEVKSQLKLIEAGFMNKAVIAQNYGPYTIDGIQAINKDGSINPNGNALLVDMAKNHKMWAKYIIRLTKDRELLDMIRENLRKDMMAKYDVNVVAESRAEFYKKIMEERNC